MPKARPKHLNLLQIRLPLPAFVSILHRVSGAVLFLFIGLFLWLLDTSLASPESFATIRKFAGIWYVKLVLLGFLWAYLHHLFAGIRHLALDMHIGAELASARASSWAVLIGGIAVTAVVGAMSW